LSHVLKSGLEEYSTSHFNHEGHEGHEDFQDSPAVTGKENRPGV
jgi:hypothetical protein